MDAFAVCLVALCVTRDVRSPACSGDLAGSLGPWCGSQPSWGAARGGCVGRQAWVAETVRFWTLQEG